MRHEWEWFSPENLYDKLRGEPRRCKLCGAVQFKEAQYLWMRVTGYSWRPLAGKCTGKPQKED